MKPWRRPSEPTSASPEGHKETSTDPPSLIEPSMIWPPALIMEAASLRFPVDWCIDPLEPDLSSLVTPRTSHRLVAIGYLILRK